MNVSGGEKAQVPLEIPKRLSVKHKFLTGQAVLELAIFGAILIMLLGVLLNYGLRDSLQQKATMSAFRGALKESANSKIGGQGNFMLVEDNHIPNPSNPFAVGSVMPFIANSNVIRSAALHETADRVDELPRITIDIKGSKCPGSVLSVAGSNPPCYYLTAGFRDIQNVITVPIDCGSDGYGTPVDCGTTTVYAMPTGMSKYKEVYGDGNAWTIRDCFPDGYGGPVCTDAGIRLIDSCEGEIIDYNYCKRQCRLITNNDFCRTGCEKGKEPSSTKDCSAVCNQDIEIPWYCQSWNAEPGKIVLDRLFKFNNIMGVQQDYAQRTTMYNTLRKTEGAGGLHTTDSINWTTFTDRDIVYMDKSTHDLKRPIPKISTKVRESTGLDCQDGVCH
jgi:hypothetical protein